ncbi:MULTISPECIES: transposase [unclassified Pigmentiphaga]|uniref:transposase n=1 Tax=unclassified Pigmentiphaga TaxID=2626614 RepID=UPI00105373C7|nr:MULTISPECIES: transposase [unclassified Pigmentiphaga]
MSTSEVRPSNRKGRLNYPKAYKREVAMAACELDVSVAKVALAHGLNANMVFKWRRELRAGLFGPEEGCTLVPVTVSDVRTKATHTDRAGPSPVETTLGTDSRIEIELNGKRSFNTARSVFSAYQHGAVADAIFQGSSAS